MSLMKGKKGLIMGVVIVNPLTFILPSKINFSACLREQTPALDNFFAILSHSGGCFNLLLFIIYGNLCHLFNK